MRRHRRTDRTAVVISSSSTSAFTMRRPDRGVLERVVKSRSAKIFRLADFRSNKNERTSPRRRTTSRRTATIDENDRFSARPQPDQPPATPPRQPRLQIYVVVDSGAVVVRVTNVGGRTAQIVRKSDAMSGGVHRQRGIIALPGTRRVQCAQPCRRDAAAAAAMSLPRPPDAGCSSDASP